MKERKEKVEWVWESVVEGYINLSKFVLVKLGDCGEREVKLHVYKGSSKTWVSKTAKINYKSSVGYKKRILFYFLCDYFLLLLFKAKNWSKTLYEGFTHSAYHFLYLFNSLETPEFFSVRVMFEPTQQYKNRRIQFTLRVSVGK